ncbi:unnamed protein product [Tuber aestivum]|uniref:Far11/STRP C-terminal domain-containing protein n=1 Tax=Tuber aestivum TaxID=59557 RepID=A0A292Q0G9_9PEZI|nr:unnamed protein product [Tuber aestivum]
MLHKLPQCLQEYLHLYVLKEFRGKYPTAPVSCGDMDNEVEESWLQEQALRSLTHFYNAKRYPKSMGADPEMMDVEGDFFRREIGKMDVGEWDASGLEG